MIALGSQKNGPDLNFCVRRVSLACGSVSCGKYRFERASSELSHFFVESFRTSWLPVPEDPGRQPNERYYCVLFQQQQQNKCPFGYNSTNDRMWKQLHAGQASGNTLYNKQPPWAIARIDIRTAHVKNIKHWTYKNSAHLGQPPIPGTEQNWFVALPNG